VEGDWERGEDIVDVESGVSRRCRREMLGGNIEAGVLAL
jgi:hypothetical protein